MVDGGVALSILGGVRSERARQKAAERRRRKRVQRKHALRAGRGTERLFEAAEVVSLLDAAHCKMSDALAELAQPVLQKLDNEETVERVLRLTAIAWNLTVTHGGDLPLVAQALDKDDLAELCGSNAEMRNLLLMLAGRKVSLFEHDRRMVLSVSTYSEGGHLKIHAASTLPM